MTVYHPEIYKKATTILKKLYGKNAKFREGQYEAIEAVLTHRRTIVVQKTGWGKSLVYFISAKMVNGLTLIISPLLVLMDNQLYAAEKMGLHCTVLSGRVKGKARALILEEIRKQKYDVVFTTPETLYSEDMKRILPDLNIDLFVVDECHCISDWGHDFRPEYGELYDVLSTLPDNVSVLGTTATANDRVLRDLKKQFGSNVYISKGALTRESLHIQILHLDTKAERYAWIRRNIDILPGSGIIYCLTQRDCQNLSDFLCREGISARPYYSSDYLNKIDDLTGMSLNEETEQLFLDNQIKVIVATIKLGMGYDKSNIGFVIHFQRPNSIVAYYQQIGRAGRQEGSNAYCFLMAGKEDRAISEYFIENAFPTEQQEQQVISALEQAEDGLRKYDFSSYCNISPKALEHTIHILRIHKMIYREGNRYYRSMVPYKYPGVYYSEVKKTKYEELDVMNQYTETKECLSRFIVSELNDDTACNCGKCANCLRKDVLPGLEIPDIDEISEIQEELNALYIEILPRKKWPEINTLDDKTKISIPNEVGLALSRYGEVGIGEMVKFDKYAANYFREELVKRSAIVIIEKLKGKNYELSKYLTNFAAWTKRLRMPFRLSLRCCGFRSRIRSIRKAIHIESDFVLSKPALFSLIPIHCGDRSNTAAAFFSPGHQFTLLA